MGIRDKAANDGADSFIKESGIFTWDLETNTVYADSALSSLFGLDRREAERGLPIEIFLERMHVEDRPSIARLIHESIVTGLPYQSEYRVADVNGNFTPVTAFGRCFRNAENKPSHYAGIVFASQTAETGPTGDLVWHCLRAYELARAQDKETVARLLLRALQELKLTV
jgi:PAS domain-containing protein